jgi:CRP-like cAMP-binding protein
VTGVEFEVLRKIPLFRDLDAQALRSLAAVAWIRVCDRREVIVRQDDPADAVFLIKRGRASVSMMTRDGHALMIGELGAGEIIGEISLLDGGGRSATVAAMTPAELVGVSRQSFLEVIEKQPRIAVALLPVLASRLRRLTQWADDLAGLPLPARLAKLLLGLATEYGQPVGPERIRLGMKIPQQEIATRLGVTRESINKHFRRWQTQSVLTCESGHLVITDLAKLRTVACLD